MFEWFIVFILIAPGTFPALGIIFLTCISFARRRLGHNVADPSGTEGNAAGEDNSGVVYQRLSDRDGVRDRKHEVSEDNTNHVLVSTSGGGQAIR